MEENHCGYSDPYRPPDGFPYHHGAQSVGDKGCGLTGYPGTICRHLAPIANQKQGCQGHKPNNVGKQMDRIQNVKNESQNAYKGKGPYPPEVGNIFLFFSHLTQVVFFPFQTNDERKG